jgi:hypothetical protein
MSELLIHDFQPNDIEAMCHLTGTFAGHQLYPAQRYEAKSTGYVKLLNSSTKL